MDAKTIDLMGRLLLLFLSAVAIVGALPAYADAPQNSAQNPILWADVPDPSIIRVGNTYYMSSTTMHMNPGLPIMKSRDLVNWQLVNYAYDTLGDMDELALRNGKNNYGRGSWASSLRYHKGVYYVTTFSSVTRKTYIFQTRNIEKGPWKQASFEPALHDHSLFFDDDGRVYMANGSGNIRLIELTSDASGIKPGGVNQVIIPNASLVAGPNVGLQAEGSQLFKINGKYYLFCITWPRRGMRTELVFRADKITGPYEGRVALSDQGVAQGGLIDTPDGKWYAYLFQDHGAVGRTPFLVPVKWEEDWPVLGTDGKAPLALDMPAARNALGGITSSDEFDRSPRLLAGLRKSPHGENDYPRDAFPLAWQWNHNPDNRFWSLAERPGWLRLTTGRVDATLVDARNTLTQRMFGPHCAGIVSLDTSGMKDGDTAGLAAFQKNYGYVAVRATGNSRSIVMVSAESGAPTELTALPLEQKNVFLKIEADFERRTDRAFCYYSLNGENWNAIGSPLKMTYTLPHFMGYRFALFNFATKSAGGWADFDYFHVQQNAASSAPTTISMQSAPGNAVSVQGASGNSISAQSAAGEIVPLRNAFEGTFLIGTTVNYPALQGKAPMDAAIAVTHFNALTPENSMKPNALQRTEGQFTFADGDRLVEMAEKCGAVPVGHTLIWHEQTPAWFFQGQEGKPVSRELALARLRKHISTVVGHYKGRVKQWDVVNEALSDAPGELLRQTPWLKAIGPDYIAEAFRAAHQADPDAILIYNDYNIELNYKRPKALQLLKSLLDQKVPINAVGIQSHWRLNTPDLAEAEKAIEQFGAMGLKVMITELDIGVLPTQYQGANIAVHETMTPEQQAVMNPYTRGLPDSVAQQLARRYQQVFAMFLRHKDSIGRVTIWGTQDGGSWLNNFPIRGRTEYPLLFDRDGKPKPAFFAIQQAVKE